MLHYLPEQSLVIDSIRSRSVKTSGHYLGDTMIYMVRFALVRQLRRFLSTIRSPTRLSLKKIGSAGGGIGLAVSVVSVIFYFDLSIAFINFKGFHENPSGSDLNQAKRI